MCKCIDTRPQYKQKKEAKTRGAKASQQRRANNQQRKRRTLYQKK